MVHRYLVAWERVPQKLPGTVNVFAFEEPEILMGTPRAKDILLGR
jgi:hypothetical protein